MCGPRIKAELESMGGIPLLDRRQALKLGASAALAAGTIGLASCSSDDETTNSGSATTQIVDLTYRLTTDFPTFFGDDEGGQNEIVNDYDEGFYIQSWTFNEQWGTHMDAPGHFGPEAWKIDQIPAERLYAPLAVIDIRPKADEDPNAVVEIDDITASESELGPIPDGSFVAMHSGWQSRRDDGNDAYRGGAGFPDLNFPGFSIDAAEWLANERDVVGIGVDTLSLDPGNSPDFAVHYGFLPTNRYGVENLANLDKVDPRGMNVFVGAVPWQDGSGGPSRVIAVR